MLNVQVFCKLYAVLTGKYFPTSRKIVVLFDFLTMKKKAQQSFEMSANIYQSIDVYIPQDFSVHKLDCLQRVNVYTVSDKHRLVCKQIFVPYRKKPVS